MEHFDAIGFDLTHDAFDDLVEFVSNEGERTSIYRRGAFIHGRCLRLGQGLEVWTILYETKQGLYYADCRPAYRSARVYSVTPWELTEYDEEGGAVVTGLLHGTTSEVTFELQNLTELNAEVFKLPYLHVSLAGLAERVRITQRPQMPQLTPARNRRGDAPTAENDYLLRGPIVSWRKLHNEVTDSEIWLLDVDTGIMNLEVLVNETDLQGPLTKDCCLTANIWLQGHVLDQETVDARYEGPDLTATSAHYWVRFKRDN